MKKKFYVIAHNPNIIGNVETPQSAVWALQQGANALEPDIVFEDGTFWVYDNSFLVHPMGRPGDAMNMEEYLLALSKALLLHREYKLELLYFDLKTQFNFPDFFRILKNNFLRINGNIPIIFARPDDVTFLQHIASYFKTLCKGLRVAVATDQSDDAAAIAERFNGATYAYGFGNGTSSPLSSPASSGIYESVRTATALRNSHNSFSFVFAWTVNNKSSMEKYLNLGVDALITDNPIDLKQLITEKYADRYALEYNHAPFNLI